MAKYYLQVPLKEEDIKKIRIGDLVYFSGIPPSRRPWGHILNIKY